MGAGPSPAHGTGKPTGSPHRFVGSKRRYTPSRDQRSADLVGADVLIRDCGAGDIEALERHMPTWDGQVHAHLFDQQQAGLWTYMVAWTEDSVPAGVCGIRWDSLAEEVPAPSVEWPRLTNLHVHPTHRGRGVGTALIEAAEDKVRGRGFSRLGISVADDNPEAARLYARLGYVDSGLRRESRYLYPDDAGVLAERVEREVLLVKALHVGCD